MSKDIETIEEVLRNMQFEDIENMNRGEHLKTALQSIKKIIERDVIGENYTKRRRVLSNGIYTHQRQRKGGGTEVVERDTALVANSVRNEQHQALTNALYGKGAK